MGLIRILLALSVVMVHSRPLFGYEPTIMVMGKNAVQMFYTISGFYMALILCTKYTGPGSYRTFISARFLRIYPAYATVALATVAAGMAVYAATGRPIPLFRAWADYGPGLSAGTLLYLIGTNILLLGQDIAMFFYIPADTGTLTFIHENIKEPLAQRFLAVPQAWTVGTELWFYLLAPFLVRRVRTIVVVMAAGLLVRLYLFQGLGYANTAWNYRFFPAELPLFLSGALGYHAYAALQSRSMMPRWLGRAAFFGMLFLILTYYKLPWHWFPSPSKPLQLDLIEVLFPLALPFIFDYTRRNHVDRLIGELSYPVYLTHWIVIALLRITGSPWVDRNLGLLACLLTLATSTALWYFVDRPIDEWRQNLSRRSSGRARRPELAPRSEQDSRRVAPPPELVAETEADGAPRLDAVTQPVSGGPGWPLGIGERNGESPDGVGSEGA